MIAAAAGVAVTLEQRARLADLYCAYDDVLNGGALEQWPGLFADPCLYKIVERASHEQGFPVAVIYCESRDMLMDRVVALRETALFAPRIARRITSGICVRSVQSDGLCLTASFAIYQTMPDQPSALFLCGSCQDRVVDDAGVLRFAERICIYDSTIVPTSLVYPI
ncbi:MAG TPA: aromatic-ring-hydroxylating dioxygenase subunit beta [Acetobacteraceae bacterium]|nr:aromatic-ring-hydroxylating dioxygenase subunit beta [Acetobacteraceae bacterium]